jgi:hypothetical protein
LIVDEGGQYPLVKMTDKPMLSRVGMLGNGLLVDSRWVADGRLLSVFNGTSSLMEVLPDSTERVIAHAREYGRIVSVQGQALLDRKTSNGRWLVAWYDASTRRLIDLTSGPMDRDPLWMPGGTRFAYVVASDTPQIRICDLRSPHRCDTFAADGGAARLAGVSPSGASLVFYSRTGVQIRMRLLETPGGAWKDLGPLTVNCRVRWTEEHKLWFADRKGPGTSWIEFDTRERKPTGNREAASRMDVDGCPVPHGTEVAATLRLADRQETELWLVPAKSP